MTEHEEGAPNVFQAPAGPEPRGARRAFREWRRSRPFWGGLLVLLGGTEMLLLYKAPMKVTIHMGAYGLAGYLVPILLIVLGLSLVFDPQHRTFYSILALLFAIASWMTSNLGGFLFGMVLAMTGASLAYGWAAAPAAQGEEEEQVAPEGLPTS